MQKIDTPYWLVKKYLNKIRNRYSHYIQSKEKIITNDANYTWARCYHKAKSKLYYRFNHCNKDEEDSWMNLIAFIKARLMQHFDNEHEWRVTEYKILEKMNKQEFSKKESPSIIWHYIAVSKAGRANKFIKRDVYHRQRTDKYNWADVIGNSKIRLKNYLLVDESKQDDIWGICFFANFEKIRSRFRWLDWNSAIDRNFKKLNRLLKTEITK